jgi:RNA polymerase sigma-70 factor, ECF subfamily
VLLEQLRNGQQSALSHLYIRYRERLLLFCIRLLNDEQKAEDAVQNVFVKLQTEHASIRNVESLKSWIFTVARNEAFGELRRRKGEVLDEDIVWQGELQDDELFKKDRKEIVKIILNSLHPSYREVIILREYDQLSYEEIGQITGATLATVKTRLFKARKALIDKLKPYLFERSL